MLNCHLRAGDFVMYIFTFPITYLSIFSVEPPEFIFILVSKPTAAPFSLHEMLFFLFPAGEFTKES